MAEGCSQIATTHMRTSGVVVVAVIGFTGDDKIISSVHEVSHTRSGRVDVALVTRGNILLDAHSHGVLELLAMAVIDLVDGDMEQELTE
jgi:hypothetical protein